MRSSTTTKMVHIISTPLALRWTLLLLLLLVIVEVLLTLVALSLLITVAVTALVVTILLTSTVPIILPIGVSSLSTIWLWWVIVLSTRIETTLAPNMMSVMNRTGIRRLYIATKLLGRDLDFLRLLPLGLLGLLFGFLGLPLP